MALGDTILHEIESANRPESPAATKLDALTKSIFVVITGVLLFVAGLLTTSLYFQYSNYRKGIDQALKGVVAADHNSIITYSRAWDFAVVKTSAMFLGFTLIFVGALYILRAADAGYQLSIKGGDVQGSLQSSSPGLIMATLGVFLVGWVIYSKSIVDYHPLPSSNKPNAAAPIGASQPKTNSDRPVTNKTGRIE
jgi:hypothetical protein